MLLLHGGKRAGLGGWHWRRTRKMPIRANCAYQKSPRLVEMERRLGSLTLPECVCQLSSHRVHGRYLARRWVATILWSRRNHVRWRWHWRLVISTSNAHITTAVAIRCMGSWVPKAESAGRQRRWCKMLAPVVWAVARHSPELWRGMRLRVCPRALRAGFHRIP